MTNSLSIGRIAGIQINLDWSLIFIFLLITWNLTTVFTRTHPDWGGPLSLTVAVVATILFLLSVLIHEMAHALMALRQGVKVRKITLFMFGGVAELEREPPSPRAEFLITIVGPLSSFLLGAIFLGLGSLFARVDMMLTNPEGLVSRLDALSALFLWLGPINIVLAVFNMLPGFPLDGGRVLRSILWATSGSLRKATRWATYVGQGVAWLFIVAGIAMAFGASIPFLGRGVLGGLWLAFIGWFLNSAAQQTYRQVAIEDVLDGVSVRDMMGRDTPAVAYAATVASLVNEQMMATDDHAFPVLEGDRFVGMVTLDEVRKLPRENWPLTYVGQIMTPVEKLTVTSPDEKATSALSQLAGREVHQLHVVKEGVLLGVLRQRDIIRWLQLHGERPI
jgi:Zn-dependent protease/CBS domain-containing protein